MKEGNNLEVVEQRIAAAIQAPQENPSGEVIQEREVTRVGFKPTTFRTGI